MLKQRSEESKFLAYLYYFLKGILGRYIIESCRSHNCFLVEIPERLHEFIANLKKNTRKYVVNNLKKNSSMLKKVKKVFK